MARELYTEVNERNKWCRRQVGVYSFADYTRKEGEEEKKNKLKNDQSKRKNEKETHTHTQCWRSLCPRPHLRPFYSLMYETREKTYMKWVAEKFQTIRRYSYMYHTIDMYSHHGHGLSAGNAEWKIHRPKFWNEIDCVGAAYFLMANISTSRNMLKLKLKACPSLHARDKVLVTR